ncbi:unnamed protein product [Rangifer tarandus platyrhynchus]|uniref:Uncharacterized protein n=2 Tax=Rangifer tarandus platyrhynchus TaxID=3082113 RepID=A0ABN8XWI0_RANTA|nr:unnamed protein product [Rangifer tarandus platyrhynchus]CAI9690329.1 unnamed protein product [Rangifer tarandus platyrhynchus]
MARLAPCCSPALVTGARSPPTRPHVRAARLLLPRVGHCPSAQPGMVLSVCPCGAAAPYPTPVENKLPEGGACALSPGPAQAVDTGLAFSSPSQVPKSQGGTAVLCGHHEGPPAFLGWRCIGLGA